MDVSSVRWIAACVACDASAAVCGWEVLPVKALHPVVAAMHRIAHNAARLACLAWLLINVVWHKRRVFVFIGMF